MNNEIALLKQIEKKILDYYQLESTLNIEEFLISELQLHTEEVFSFIAKSTKEQRAAVFYEVQNGETFLGIFFSEEILNILKSDNPLHNLHNKNLDALSVCIEEISHFHLLINRLNCARTTSHLELEWQAEVDKFLISSLLLEEQSGFHHAKLIAHQIFDLGKIVDISNPHYINANKFAAKFCFHLVKEKGHLKRFLYEKEVRQLMIENYHLPLQDKKMFYKKANYIIAA